MTDTERLYAMIEARDERLSEVRIWLEKAQARMAEYDFRQAHVCIDQAQHASYRSAKEREEVE